MPEREPQAVQLVFEVLPDDARLKARDKSLAVDLERATHPLHIDDERILSWEDAAADAASRAIRDDRERALVRHLNKSCHFLGGLGPSDEGGRGDGRLTAARSDLLPRPEIAGIRYPIGTLARDVFVRERGC